MRIRVDTVYGRSLWLVFGCIASAAAVPASVADTAAPAARPAATPLDSSLRPAAQADEAEAAAGVFKDMGVVQKQAMKKSGRFLLSTYGGFDFSDGPYTQYAFNINPGYAVSDFFEIYAQAVPVFIASERSIVKKVSSLTLLNNQKASITSPKPKFAYGVEFLWAPLYGKDSLGMRSIVRSDTFFKLGVGQIKYETGSGMRFLLGLGKTFFLGKHTGLRITADFGYVQTIVDSLKSFTAMAIVESGLVFYF